MLDPCRNGSSSSVLSEESDDAENSAASQESDAAAVDRDADDFQQATKPRSKKSAYDVDVSDSEQDSDSDSSAAKRKGNRRSSRGKTVKSDVALPARRQPRRTAAARVSLAESANESSEADSQQSSEEEEEEEAKDASGDNQEDSRSKKRIGRDCKADKTGIKRQKALVAEEDSDVSMAEADNEDALVISDSEAQADEESDKENHPTKQTRYVLFVSLQVNGCTPLRQTYPVPSHLYRLHVILGRLMGVVSHVIEETSQHDC